MMSAQLSDNVRYRTPIIPSAPDVIFERDLFRNPFCFFTTALNSTHRKELFFSRNKRRREKEAFEPDNWCVYKPPNCLMMQLFSSRPHFEPQLRGIFPERTRKIATHRFARQRIFSIVRDVLGLEYPLEYRHKSTDFTRFYRLSRGPGWKDVLARDRFS